MPLPVTIENEAISLQVWPAIGGKISAIVDKADKYDLLFNYPAELPIQESRYDLPYANSWYAGWDECFPAVAACKYTGHPYDGIPVPDHGELYGLPTTAVPTKDGITTVWHGLRFGYRLTRKLYLDGPSLVAEYTLINLAPFEFRFVWSPHPLMAMTQPIELQFDGERAFRFNQDSEGVEAQQGFEWPVGTDGDFSKPTTLPANRGWKLFSMSRIASPLTVNYPSRGRSLKIEYASVDDLPAHWGIWINTGGWAGHRHFAIEPTTGRFDHLDRAVKDNSAGSVYPMGRRQWATRWTLG